MKCPHCGVGPLTRNFLGSVEVCPECGYRFLGQTGDFWGGVVLTYVFDGGAGVVVSALLVMHQAMSTVAVTFVAAGVVVARVWAAAGAPNSVVRLKSDDLERVTGGRVADVKKA